jgi:hypothetical protein
MNYTGCPSSEEEDMNKVLMISAIAVIMACAVAADCPNAMASYTDNRSTPSVEGVQPPSGGQGDSVVCGGGSAEGDPDDLGGGFRSTNGPTKQSVGEIKPPVPPFVDFRLSVQRFWMMLILR